MASMGLGSLPILQSFFFFFFISLICVWNWNSMCFLPSLGDDKLWVFIDLCLELEFYVFESGFEFSFLGFKYAGFVF